MMQKKLHTYNLNNELNELKRRGNDFPIISGSATNFDKFVKFVVIFPT